MSGARLRRAAGAPVRWRWLALGVGLVFALFGASVAWGYWTSVASTGSATAAATSLNQGSTPTAVGQHTQVTLSWGATTTTSSGEAADGYIVRRYNAATGLEQTVGAGCSGVVTATTCTETGLPGGQWTYTVTPTLGVNWRGAESPHSGVVQTGLSTLTLTQSVFGAAAVATTGAITGFLPGEGITYVLDGTPVAGSPLAGGGTVIAGSPSVAGADGSATITSLSIPAGLTDGNHKISAVGDGSVLPSLAQASILVDTTAPVLSAVISPAPNAAGWNNTSPVTVTTSVDTNGGSGLASIVYTDDDSDPLNSTTARNGFVDGVITTVVATQTTTYKYVATDEAGNSTGVITGTIDIDTTAPVPSAASLVNVTGGAYLNQAAGITYYRGAAAGSFQLQTAATDPGGSAGSGLASASNTVLTGTDAGFSIDAGTITTPPGGPFVLSPVSWVAGTTSNPTGNVEISDVAGNSIVFPAQIVNDSAAPSAGSVAATGLTGPGGDYSQSLNVNLSLAQGSDSGSGLARGSSGDLPDTLLRASAPLTSSDGVANGTCGTYGSYVQVQSNPSATVTDTVPADHACYRYEYLVADHVGNVATYTSSDIKVQTDASASLTPSAVSVTPVSGISAQSVSGSTVYYNPASLGSFQASGSASAPFSGVANMTFPAIAGFTGGGAVTTPLTGATFAATYAWTVNSSSSSPGIQPLSATNNAGQTATNASAFTVIADATGPAGGSVDATSLTGSGGRYSTSTTLNIVMNQGTDSGAGLASSGAQLLRASASLTAGVCGTYGAYNQVGANDPGSPDTDTVPANNTCYRYQYLVSDNVGNQTTYTSPDIKVDTGAPSTPTLTFSGLNNSYWNATGNAVYYNPTASNGAFTLTAQSTDAGAGVASYSLPTLPSGWSSTAGASGVKSYSYSAANPTVPTGALNVTATSNTSIQSAASTFTVIPDTAGPTGGSVDATGLTGTGSRYSTSTNLNIAFSKGTDSGSGLAPNGAQLLRASATLNSNGTANGSCGSYGAYQQVGSNDPGSPDRDTVPADNTCYRYEYVVSDNVGNQTTYTSPDIKVDTTAPPSPALSFTALSNTSWNAGTATLYYRSAAASGGFTLTASAADTNAGISGYGLATLPSGWSASPGGTGIQSYGWVTANPTAPTNPLTVTATNNAGTQAQTSFTATADSAPPAGGSVSYTNGTITTATTAITFASGTDAGSGVSAGSAQLQRAVATLTGTTCGSFGAFSTIATAPSSPYTDAVSVNNCYEYRYVVVDNVGNQATYTSPSVLKVTASPPTNSLTLSGATGAYLNGLNLYFNSNNSGSFNLVDALTSVGSTPTSVTYLAMNQSGWIHNAETVSTPAGGPFSSSTFSWSAHPNSPGTYTVTGLNSAGVQGTATLSFISDQSPPTGGSISYPSGIVNTPSVAITTTNGTDAQSGINPVAGVVKRDTATLTTSTDSCATFPGTFATTVTLVGGADTSVSNGHCYQYRYYPSDNVGNQATYTSSNIVKLDTTPKVTAISSGNGNLQLNDQLVLTFNESLAPATVPSTFTGATESRPVTGNTKLTIPGITNGALDTGSNGYLAGNQGSGVKTATFGGTVTLSNNGASTTITLTVTSVTGDPTNAGSGALTFLLAPTIIGPDGTAPTGTFVTTSAFQLF